MKPIKIPVIADTVMTPIVYYGDFTGIYFHTENDKSGRIIFENPDAIKICRGE